MLFRSGNLTPGTVLTVGSNACDNPNHVYHNSCLSAEDSVEDESKTAIRGNVPCFSLTVVRRARHPLLATSASTSRIIEVPIMSMHYGTRSAWTNLKSLWPLSADVETHFRSATMILASFHL